MLVLILHRHHAQVQDSMAAQGHLFVFRHQIFEVQAALCAIIAENLDTLLHFAEKDSMLINSLKIFVGIAAHLVEISEFFVAVGIVYMVTTSASLAYQLHIHHALLYLVCQPIIRYQLQNCHVM